MFGLTDEVTDVPLAFWLTVCARADEVLASEYPAIPVFHYASRTLVRRYVRGFDPERVLSLVRLKRVSVDEEH